MNVPALGENGINDVDALALPFCPTPNIVSVDQPSSGSLSVEWDAPIGYEGNVRSYDIRYTSSTLQDPPDSDWELVKTGSRSTSRTLGSLTIDVEYRIQIRAMFDPGPGAWSASDLSYSPRYVAPPQRPMPAPTPTHRPAPTPIGPRPALGGGGASTSTLPTTGYQSTEELLRPLRVNGNLVRAWRLISPIQRWWFYDPDPDLASFNTLTRVNMDSDPPIVLAVKVHRAQAFRGMTVYPGWNLVPITTVPLASKTGSGVERVEELFEPLIENGTLGRIWWLDSSTQEWSFFDPAPEIAAFNSLQTVNPAANPPVILSVIVTKTQPFRDVYLYAGRNYLIVR